MSLPSSSPYDLSFLFFVNELCGLRFYHCLPFSSSLIQNSFLIPSVLETDKKASLYFSPNCRIRLCNHYWKSPVKILLLAFDQGRNFLSLKINDKVQASWVWMLEAYWKHLEWRMLTSFLCILVVLSNYKLSKISN